MLKHFLTFFFLLLLPLCIYAQTSVNGVISDSNTGETLIGATVMFSESDGVVTDFDGKFYLSLPNGTHKLKVSYVGYTGVEKDIVVAGSPLFIEIKMENEMIDEVLVTADVARSRETPVAFTNVLAAKLNEQLAGQDIPMILNSTPGVYATQQGGGDGDARITIRGFNQRYVAVMIDGIPVNDMENGWVYWSNWFGLDAVTRTIQVQRGLGASKLALPSVGGTLNIITKGIESRQEIKVSEEIDFEGKYRTSIGFTTGELGNGFSISGAGSYKRGQGWVDETFTQGWFYYLKIDKRLGKHILSASAMGAPQEHYQRSYKMPMASFDADYAAEQGLTDEELQKYTIFDKGIAYNQHWGYVNRNRFNPDAEQELISEKINMYHKPQFTFRDFWQVGTRFSVTNILYASFGNGGGTGTKNSLKTTNRILDPNDPNYGQIDWQSIYDVNAKPTQGPFGTTEPINPMYSNSLYYSTNFLTISKNNHQWFGFLSTGNFQLNEIFNISGGIDLRSYEGYHWKEVYDLFGGDYAIDVADKRLDYEADSSNAMKYNGDKIEFYNIGHVRWGGLFGQVEAKFDNISTFLNITLAESGYKKSDLFNDTVSNWRYFTGYTAKTGLNYNLNSSMNVFFNMGYMSRVRAYQYYFKGFSADFLDNVDNEIIKAVEVGYTFGSPKFSANINGYYTEWDNRPSSTVRFQFDEKDAYADVIIDARHMGVELDFAYKILKNLELQGLVSVGDWIWDKNVKALPAYFSDGSGIATYLDFDTRGIHVGDAAQTQFGASLRYEPFKGFYVSLRTTYFDRYFSEFSPEKVVNEFGVPTDSWQIPAYNLVDMNMGYSRKVGKLDMSLRFNVLNVLDEMYISDATNNDGYNEIPYSEFDAKSASVFFGAGRRFNTSFSIRF